MADASSISSSQSRKPNSPASSVQLSQASVVHESLLPAHLRARKVSTTVHRSDADEAHTPYLPPPRTRSVHPDGVTLETYERLLAKTRRKKFRNRVYRDLVLYVCFFVNFLVIVFLSRDLRSAYFLENGLEDLFVNEEFLPQHTHIKKTFYDIGHVDELWEWLQGPFVNAVVQTDDAEQAFVLRYNRLIGPPRLRQVRVADSCAIDPRLATFVRGGCYPDYSEARRSTAAYGPAHNESLYRFVEWQAPPVLGWVTDYDGDGFQETLSLQADETRRLLAQLKENRWVDEQTRAIIISVNVFNANVNMFLNMLFIVELNAGGGFVPWRIFRSYRADPYLEFEDWALRLPMEIVFLCGLLGWIVYTIRQIVRHSRRGLSVLDWFVSPWWNTLDTLNKVMLLAASIQYAVLYAELREVRAELPQLREATADFRRLEWLAFRFSSFQALQTANIFVSTLTIFKYLEVNKRMSLLWRTLVKAAGDLLAFTIFFFIVFFGFVFTGHLLFGTSLYDFRTFSRSFFTCFQMLLGEFEYETMEEDGHRLLAPIFFSIYIFLVFFVLVNMFLAIINEAYAAVHEQVSDSMTIGQSARRFVARAWKNWQRRARRFWSHGVCAFGGGLSARKLRKYLEQVVHVHHAVHGDAPSTLIGVAQLERLLDAPHDTIVRVYEAVHDYGELLDERYEGEEEDWRRDALLSRQRPKASVQMAQEYAETISAKLRGLEAHLRQRKQRAAAAGGESNMK